MIKNIAQWKQQSRNRPHSDSTANLLDALKLAAKREYRSLTNFVETLLMRVMYTEPKEETRVAIAEVRSKEKGKYMTV